MPWVTEVGEIVVSWGQGCKSSCFDTCRKKSKGRGKMKAANTYTGGEDVWKVEARRQTRPAYLRP